MSTDTLQTLTDQYRFQVEALQKENEALKMRLKEATDIIEETYNEIIPTYSAYIKFLDSSTTAPKASIKYINDADND